MPLSLPYLDDRRYADLVEEARALIPSLAPEWTNHNPSDPGITLVELFAYLTEMLVYRVNRVTDDNVRAFLNLITGAAVDESKPLAAEVRGAVLGLRSTVRAVTAEDYEALAVAAHDSVARALCLPLCNLDSPDPFKHESPGHVSVVVVPKERKDAQADVSELVSAVRADLEKRKLLTTRLHVKGPRYATLRLGAELMLTRGALERAPTTEVKERGAVPAVEAVEEKQQKGVVELAVEALERFFDPISGGPQGGGWPFGRSIYLSEIYALLDALPGVDYVSRLDPTLAVEQRAGAAAGEDGAARQRMNDKELYAFALDPDELVDVQVEEADITVKRPVVDLKGEKG